MSLSRFASLSFLAVALFVGAPALSAPVDPLTEKCEAKAKASEFLDCKVAKVRALLGTPASPEREKKVDAELKLLVDYDDMAKVALGAEYDKHSKEELAEFTDILRQLIEKNYKKRLQDTLRYKIVVTGEEPKASDFLVKTQATNLEDKKAAVVLIDYVLRKKNGAWIAIDLIPEGSSMAKTYNKEFTKVIKKDGWPSLIKKMKDKLAKT